MRKSKLLTALLALCACFCIAGAIGCDKTEKHTVTFDTSGGSVVESLKVEDGKKATKPENPTKFGYRFDGWYVGDEEWSFIGYNITEDITLTAKWVLIGTEGLAYKKIEGKEEYACTGIGTATDTDIEIVVIYNGLPVTSIGDGAFYGCSALTSVIIPDSVTSIGNYAFWCCDNLTSVVIPDSITSVGDYAFDDCDNLQYTVKNGLKYQGNENNPYVYLEGQENPELNQATIEKGCKVIASYAFEDCSNLTTIVIPDSVISVGYKAFSNCSNLASVVIPDGVTYIASSAFSGCVNLTSVEIPDSVTYIGKSVFDDCNNLQYTVKNGLKYVGNENNPYVYLESRENSDITQITIEKGCRVIGYDAFWWCDNLTSVVIPDSVVYIDYKAFSWCWRLTSVYYKGTESDWAEISIKDYNSNLTDATRYYYSETEPTTAGNYWHYDENGEVAVW